MARKTLLIDYGKDGLEYLEFEVPSKDFNLAEALLHLAINFHSTPVGKQECTKSDGFTISSLIANTAPAMQKSVGLTLKKRMPIDLTAQSDFVLWNKADFSFFEKYVNGQLDFNQTTRFALLFALWVGRDVDFENCKVQNPPSKDCFYAWADEYWNKCPEKDVEVFYRQKLQELLSQ